MTNGDYLLKRLHALEMLTLSVISSLGHMIPPGAARTEVEEALLEHEKALTYLNNLTRIG